MLIWGPGTAQVVGHNFRVRDQSPWYDVNVLFPLLAGAYVDPRSGEQALPPPPVHDPERSVKRPLEGAGGEGGEVPGEEGFDANSRHVLCAGPVPWQT